MTVPRLTGAQRRERFLDAAAEIILESGVASVTMDGVAARTGVNKALGYRYFKDSADLLSALFDRENRLFDEKTSRVIRPGASFEDWLRGGLRLWIERTDERGPLFARLTNDNGALAAKALQMKENNARRWADALVQVYKLPRRRAEQFSWLIVFSVQAALSARNGEDDEDLIETLVASLLAGAEKLKSTFAV